MAHQLNQLNLLQQKYDRARHEIESLRRQLFSDWYKYMLCAYPPEDTRDDYPDIDEVKHYLEVQDIEPLKKEARETGELTLIRDENGKVISASVSDSDHESRAARLAKAITDLLQALADFNDSRNGENAKTQYLLRPVASPRYWQPKEPVVLIVGDAARPTPRHGGDGSRMDEGLLECQILQNEKVQYPIIKAHLPEIRKEIDRIEQSKDEDHFAFSTWTQQPWHPFLVEWEVEIFPMRDRGNLDPASRAYEPDFITTNCDLADNAVDLSSRPGKGAITKAANVYSGRSILTPYATVQLKDRLVVYLFKCLLDASVVDFIPPQAQEHGFRDRIDEWCKKRPWDAPDDRDIETIRNWCEGLDFEEIKKHYETRPVYDEQAPNLELVFSDLSQKQRAKDPIYTAIRAFQVLKDLPSLSQALGGFNEALLMRKQTMQLPIADPLGFDDYQPFAASVAGTVQGSIRSAPQPLNDFNPIRSGAMEILDLRLVDTFGQAQDLDGSRPITPKKMAIQDPSRVWLPPRLVQPARLNFRWLSADHDDVEMNEHPATTPVCGWLLPNNLDNSLMVYDNQGKALGYLDQNADWQPAPGCSSQEAAGEALDDVIKNTHLRTVVRYLEDQGADFSQSFISTLDAALENVDPESFAQHQGLALLMGRPIAVVRASLDLELQGRPAIHQGWNEFRRDMGQNTRETDGFTRVQFPVRLGEYRQSNDGLIGYWIEKDGGNLGDLFYVPQIAPNVQTKGPSTDSLIKIHKEGKPLNIPVSIDDPVKTFTLLVDPRARVHATSGVLPAKEIHIPPDQYSAALQAIEVTFLSTPILTSQANVNLPLPAEPGYVWSWLGKEDLERWTEVWTFPSIERTKFLESIRDANGNDESIWQRLLDCGWLQPLGDNSGRACIMPKDRRGSLPDDLRGSENAIQSIFDLYQERIEPASPEAVFSGPQVIREGWLKLSKAPELAAKRE
jgi:hypothetical protein